MHDALGKVALAAHRADFLDPAERLVERLVEVGAIGLLDQPVAPQFAADRADPDGGDPAKEDDPCDRDPRLDNHQEGEDRDEDDHLGAKLEQGAHHVVADGDDFVVDVAEQFGRVAGQEEGVGSGHVGPHQAPRDLHAPVGDVADLEPVVEGEKAVLDREDGKKDARPAQHQFVRGKARTDPGKPAADERKTLHRLAIDDGTDESGHGSQPENLEKGPCQHHQEQDCRIDAVAGRKQPEKFPNRSPRTGMALLPICDGSQFRR